MALLLSSGYVHAALAAYDAGTASDFVIKGMDSTREAALKTAMESSTVTLTAFNALGGTSPHTDTTISSGSGWVHPGATGYVNLTFTDVSGGFTDSGSGTTSAVAIFSTRNGTLTGGNQLLVGISDGHSLATDSTDDDVDFDATATFQLQCGDPTP